MAESLSGYRIFYEVANCGNISRAASRLYISQPAISKSIQKLEDSLDVRLFIRSSKGVVLTPEGKLLYDAVKDAFTSLDTGIEKIHQMSALGIGSLHIGVSSTLCRHVLLPYLKQYIKENPHVQISIITTSTNQTLQLLEERKVDIGLVGEPEHTDDITFEPLDEIKDCFVTTQAYLGNLKARGIPSEDIFRSSTLMMLDKNNMSRQYIDDYLAKNHIRTKEAIDVSDMDLLIEFARIGVGIACVIRNFVEEDLSNGTLVELPLTEPIPPRKIGLAYKHAELQNPALEKFVELCTGEK